MASEKISVVMAVYKNDKPEWLGEAIDSILNQTYKANEFIVVVDGPIPTKLNTTLESYNEKITTIRLPQNKGLWNALNTGIKAAKNDLIARMDADDISLPNRFQTQAEEFETNPDLALLGAQIDEFESDSKDIASRRSVPLSQDEIVRFAKLRSPFNHPSVMYRRQAVLEVGGYSKLMRTEDYDLWVKLIMNKCIVKNMPDTLLLYRLNSGNMNRKISATQNKESMALLKRFYTYGFLSKLEFTKAVAAKTVYTILPGFMKRSIYRKVVRR